MKPELPELGFNLCQSFGSWKSIHTVIESWKQTAKKLKVEVYALYLAARDPRTPWLAKLVAICVAGYAFSPIDLIPDPIPVLGFLDDLIILPLGIILAIKLVPGEVMVDCRKQAQHFFSSGKPVSWLAAGIIILIWIMTLGIILLWLRAWIT